MVDPRLLISGPERNLGGGVLKGAQKRVCNRRVSRWYLVHAVLQLPSAWEKIPVLGRKHGVIGRADDGIVQLVSMQIFHHAVCCTVLYCIVLMLVLTFVDDDS